MADTRRALARWNHAPADVLGPWLTLSVAVSAALLVAVYVIAKLSTPDPTPLIYPGLNAPARPGDYLHILIRNGLVLALHALACVAGFIAGNSLPLSASKRSGLSRWVHERAGPFAIGFVVCATTFSLCTQAYTIGAAASTISDQFDMGPGLLIVSLLPHALPELVVLFLPLAAWMIASRRGRWD